MSPVESRAGMAVAPGASPLTPEHIRTLETLLELELARVTPGSRVATQLLAALDRMAAGTYGSCAGCGDSIAFERLEAIPETVWCRRCSPSAPSASRRAAATEAGWGGRFPP